MTHYLRMVAHIVVCLRQKLFAQPWPTGYRWKLGYCWLKEKKERRKRLQRRQGKEKCRGVEVRVGTLNVGTMTGKGRGVADMMERRKVDKLFYHGVDGKRNGVGVILKEEYSKSVVEVKRVSDRVMNVKLDVEGLMINGISAYAPQVGFEMEVKEKFWSELDEVVDGLPRNERLVIGADFDGHVGEGNRGDEELMGRRCNLKEIGDCEVLAGDSVAIQHWMVVCRMVLEVKKKRRRVKTERRIRWWKLKEEDCFRVEVRQGIGGGEEVLDDWATTAERIRETARKVLGVTSGNRKEDKGRWWWNEELQDSIRKKKLAKQNWDRQRDEKSRQECKEMRQQVDRHESPWTMMFADDIAICGQSRKQVEKSLERWRYALERRGMKVSRSKTKYMCVNEREGSGVVRLLGKVVEKVEEFMHLESTVQGRFGDKMREVRLRWFEHVQRRDMRDMGYIGRRMLRMELPGRKKRGRPRRRFMDVVKEDMQVVFVTESDVEDRGLWRRMIRCGDP
ncbi:hypothetical protein C0J45_6004 [Silurus meridionalis]|nr:hypothetical protein C0J45_6004 [Silurus meridionalis]